MKRTILISLAAGVAIVPATLGVAAATTAFGPSSPASISSSVDDSRTASPTAASTVDDRGRGGNGADDSVTTASPTSSASSAVDRQARGSDDATTSRSTSSEARSVSPTVRQPHCGRGRTWALGEA
jgi:hypothetical protein